jgi:gluconolactonase
VEGVPDGIRADEKGNLYVTGAGVSVYSPQGTLIETLAVAETPANCAFGDQDFESLYITARTSLYRVRRTVKGASPY